MNVPAAEINGPWRRQMLGFLKWMHERGWRRHWLIFGQRVTCIGVIVPRKRHHNDNHRRI